MERRPRNCWRALCRGCTTCWAVQHGLVESCTDVEHVHCLILLPKKAFNSFCTWMLLPTVLYTPSCVAPKMKMRGGVRAVRWDEGKYNLDKERAVEMYHAEPARVGLKIQTLLPDLATLVWSSRESNGNFIGKAWVMELEKRVPAVEFTAVIVNFYRLPFLSLAQATTETLFYQNFILKRIRLQLGILQKPVWSWALLFIRNRPLCDWVWYSKQGCSFLFFPLLATLQVWHQKHNQWLKDAPHRKTNRSGQKIGVRIFTVDFNVVDALSHKLEADFVQLHCEGKEINANKWAEKWACWRSNAQSQTAWQTTAGALSDGLCGPWWTDLLSACLWIGEW